ncbi:MAG: mycofactocin biosynthesis chaperone MftB [Bacillota bacterium]|jgi:putative mycofactocin binding protein MftB
MEKHYQLARAVKVRDEEFGLLFYICKTTGLVFINSGDLLKAQALLEGGTVEELLIKSQGAAEIDQYKLNALDDLLGSLVKRGLVNAQG